MIWLEKKMREEKLAVSSHDKFMNDDDFLLNVTHLPAYCTCTQFVIF